MAFGDDDFDWSPNYAAMIAPPVVIFTFMVTMVILCCYCQRRGAQRGMQHQQAVSINYTDTSIQSYIFSYEPHKDQKLT